MIAVTGLAYSLVNSALKQTSERGAQLADSNRRLSEGTTALNQANRAFQLISACNQAITHATSTEDILHTACPNLVDIGGYGFALFAVRSDHAIQRLQTVAHAAIRASRLAARTRGLFAVDSVLTSYADWALRSGQPITFPYRAQETSQATSTQTDNSAADTYCGLFPLNKGDTPAGVMLVFSAAEENFTADEVTLLSNVAKDIAYGIVAFQSIARQKEEAARVQMTNELLTATLASIDHAVFVLEGPDRIVRMCNAKAERIFGYTADELIGHSISMVHRDRESYEAFISDRMAHLSNKQTFRTEFTAYHRDGSPRILDVTITPLRQSMSLASAEVSVVRDITEDHIKSEQLKASETNYRELFNSMREGFVLLKMIGDDDGRNVDYVIVEANPAFEEITGLPREQIVGQQVRHRFPAIDEATLASYVKVVETGEPMRSEEYIADIDKHLDITAFCPEAGPSRCHHPGHYRTIYSPTRPGRRTSTSGAARCRTHRRTHRSQRRTCPDGPPQRRVSGRHEP
ncbi:MAG: PAS domain S-box protein [Caldilineaceae bacterium]